ncbi:MAG TPA: glutamyl-tRNA reductase [Acidimicrobiales bacterium]|nr:glutamyl-tRNA reductase [Acidimicrobiales bacterium]
MSLVVIGLNHRTVPLELLERMTIGDGDLPKALHALAARPHLSEVVVLSTCNRTEVYAYVERFHGAYQDVRDCLSELCHELPEAFADHLYAHYDTDAVRHLFAVASGIDSAVLGESEVLGQVRRAWEAAQTADVAGPSLNPLFRQALEVGKRARTETSIGRHITSVSQAAVAMAAERLGTLAGRNVLVLGAGEMGEGMVLSLAAAGVAETVVANRTWGHATDLAARVDGRPIRLSDLPGALAEADLLLTSTGATSMIVETSDVASVMQRRAGRPLLIVDIAVPRDVDPGAASLDGVTLLDMDDLKAFADAGLRERRREVAAVQSIIDDELDRYAASSTAREVVPLVAALHDRAEQVRTAEIERFRSRLANLDPREREVVEALTRGIVAKLVHTPTVRVKDAAGTSRGERLADTLRDLFDL